MRISPSIYADDCAAWKVGRNLKQLSKSIQGYLDQIIKWTETWGFKLNTDKSVAVLFTNSKKFQNSINLTIQGKTLKVEKEAKFLGVTYDRQLTWKTHITNIVEKSKKAFQLMRNVAGHNWGASKRALLTIYRALVRSRLDYGAEAFYTASRSQLKRLDEIQSKCLRVCCRAFKTTANNALQQDCGEMPLSVRRKRLLLDVPSRSP